MADRTVHATYANAEIVRYDRAGKWWVETTARGRRMVSVREAAAIAIRNAAYVVPNAPGGSRFRAAVRESRGVNNGD